MELSDISMAKKQLFSELKAIDLLVLSKKLDDVSLEYRDTLGFTRGVRFGLELEYEGFSKEKMDKFIQKSKLLWESKDDTSLTSGGEVVSPKLLDEPKTWANLKTICEFLKENNADTCHNAGLHIHVGAHLLGENIDAWRRFAKIYTVYERILIRFGYGDKINARRTLFKYAKPVGLQFLNGMEILDENKSLYNAKKFYRQIYNEKKNAINLRSLEFLRAIVAMNTLEFRNFNATTEEAVVQNDVNAVVHMMLAAKDKNLDEDFLNFKLKSLGREHLTEAQYLDQCSQILLREMAEFVDLIFDETQDKVFFMKQYVKGFENGTNYPEAKMARELVKK